MNSNLRRLGITELKKRITLTSNYWTNELLSQAVKKIKSKYQQPYFQREKSLDFLVYIYENNYSKIKVESILGQINH